MYDWGGSMKVVQLNTVCGIGSTGGITVQISNMLIENQIENYILYSNKKQNYESGIKYTSYFLIRINALISRIFGNYGFNSIIITKKLIKRLKEISPDIIHIHNIHGHNVNLSMLFEYINKNNIKVIMTLHDCWSFTGYCTHFESVDCEKWKKQCFDCPLYRKHSFFFDFSPYLYNKKRDLFTSVKDMTIVSPSKWLTKMAKDSFLSKYPIITLNNGVDLNTYKKVQSNFKDKYKIGNKKIILGIPKGEMRYFLELSKLISDEYVIVLVGLTKKEMKKSPENIIPLKYVERDKMAEIFSVADVFVNTTLEDTFPTVNLEALACGTPVITFNSGGSPEAIDENTGEIVEKRDMKAVYEAVKRICKNGDMGEACIKRAKALYNSKDRFKDYFELYKRVGGYRAS